MRAGHGLLLLALIVFAGILVWDFDGAGDGNDSTTPAKKANPGKRPPAPAAPKVPLPKGDWAGSARCQECHPAIYERWSKTAHAQTLQTFSKDAVAKPFDGDRFVARDIEHVLGPGAKMTGEGPGGDDATFDVDMIIGVRRVQMFTTNFSRGRIQVLPVFLEVPDKRWFDYTDFIFGTPPDFEVPPDSYYSWYGPHRNFNSRCGRCHITDYHINYDPDEASYQTKWTERAVSCESCHGPAAEHVRIWHRGGAKDNAIVNPAKLSVEQSNQNCGFCHAEALMVDPGFRPGKNLFDFVDVAGLEDTTHTYPDGRAKELIHSLIPSMQSRCGPMSCTKCHDPHGSGLPGDVWKPLSDDATCTQCHETIGQDIEAHTHHPAASTGSRCISCHMPQLVIEGGHGKVFDHTISIPSVKNSQDFGLPNACATCHLLEDPGFEEEPFQRWYPNAEKNNHRVALAQTIAAARAKRPDAQPRLVELLKHRNPVYRAGAAFLLERYEHDLRPQLRDPQTMVRRAAIPGVALRHPEALLPLLTEKSTVLRRAAALALATKWIRKPFDYIGQKPKIRAQVRAVLEQCTELRNDHAELWRVLASIYDWDKETEKAATARARYVKLTEPG